MEPGRRRLIALGGAAAALGAAALVVRAFTRFPPDTTPEGVYLRIANALGHGDVRVCFAYLEDAAQHAAFTIRDYRRRSSERVAAAYPEAERARHLDAWRPYAEAEDGADVWVHVAKERAWVTRLRRDLSGIAKVEIAGDRATVETARGTRYAMRRRDNGIWGLTMFTADLVAEAERAARDWDVVQHAADDYARAKGG